MLEEIFMIYDKEKQAYVDIFTDPYFRNYEVAVTADGTILLLQNNEVISSAPEKRFQTDLIEAYVLATKEHIDLSTHPYFKNYEIAFGTNRILLLEYGLVKDYADSTLYGIRIKRKLKPDNNELLNPEQAAVYRYVFSYIIHHRYAPTYDEILKNCKVRSKSTVSLYIRKMLKLGLLESDAPGSSRALRLPNSV